MLTITFPEFCLFIKENSKVCYTFTLYLLNSDRWAAGALKAQQKTIPVTICLLLIWLWQREMKPAI